MNERRPGMDYLARQERDRDEDQRDAVAHAERDARPRRRAASPRAEERAVQRVRDERGPRDGRELAERVEQGLCTARGPRACHALSCNAIECTVLYCNII